MDSFSTIRWVDCAKVRLLLKLSISVNIVEVLDILFVYKCTFTTFKNNAQSNASFSCVLFKWSCEHKLICADCAEIYNNGTLVDGVYAIPPDGRCPFFVYCDMTNGGWTVIQVRKLAMFRFFLRISSKRSMLQSCLLLMNGIHIHSFLRITSNKKVCIPFNVYFRNVLTAVSTFTDPGRSTYKALES